MALNVDVDVDADFVNADWLRVAARMRVLRALRPELPEVEVRPIAERAQLASVPSVEPTI
jgi:hypothetical protein